MTPDKVAAYIVELVRERGIETGANLGQEIRRQFPEFDLSKHATSLTAFLRGFAPELGVVDQQGADLVWSAMVPDDLPDIDELLLVGSDVPQMTNGNAVRLRRGEFESFRSLSSVTVDIAPLTILVGANGSGKSNVLDAFFRALRLTRVNPEAMFTHENSVDRISTRGSKGQTRLKILGTQDYQLEWKAVLGADGLPNHTVWAATGTRKRQVQASGVPELARAFGPVMKIRLDAAQIIRPSYTQEVRPFVRHDGSNVAAVLADLAATEPDRKSAIVDGVRQIVPQVQDLRMPRALVPRMYHEMTVVDGRVYDREVRRDQPGHRLEAKIANEWIPADQLSEGILLVVALQTVLRGVRPPKVLLIDDIDRALHPKAQRVLVGHLRSIVDEIPNLTLIGTTHSPFVLDTLDVESVRVVRLDSQGHTSVAPLAEAPAWRDWSESMTPGEFWNFAGEDWLESPA